MSLEELQNDAIKIRTIRVAKNHDLEASENIFQIGHVSGPNEVKGGFQRKGSKMSL